MSTHDAPRPDDFPSDLKPFEAALAGLSPAATRINRDQLMYLAGAAAAAPAPNDPATRACRPPQMVWPSATAALFLVALGLGALVALRQPAERIVYVDRPTANPHSATAPTFAVQLPGIGPTLPLAPDAANASYLALR